MHGRFNLQLCKKMQHRWPLTARKEGMSHQGAERPWWHGIGYECLLRVRTECRCSTCRELYKGGKKERITKHRFMGHCVL